MTHTVTQDLGASRELFVGEDKVLQWTVSDSDDVVVDITGWTFEFEVRLRRYTPGTPVISKSSLTPSDGPAGEVQVPLASADTVDLRAGTYYYGLARTNTGAYDVVAEGQFVLRKAAAHA
jgi:hypothetical protein